MSDFGWRSIIFHDLFEDPIPHGMGKELVYNAEPAGYFVIWVNHFEAVVSVKSCLGQPMGLGHYNLSFGILFWRDTGLITQQCKITQMPKTMCNSFCCLFRLVYAGY